MTIANSTDDEGNSQDDIMSDQSHEDQMMCVEVLKVPQRNKNLRSRKNLKLNRRSKAIKKAPKQQPAQEKFNKQFQFFYSRTCFRGMIEYYKDLLKPIKGANKETK